MKPRSQPLTPRFSLLCLGLTLLLLLAAAVAGCGGDSETETPTPSPTQEPRSTPTPDDALTTGVYDDRIVFGQSAALEGPAQELGRNLRRGIKAAFEEQNLQGGVAGREIQLVTLDDGYEPERAATNTQQLITEEKVFALIGAVGTPTSRSAAPIAAEASVPYVAPFTGAAFLRDPSFTNVLNLRASYHQETEEMVERLTTDLGVTRIAVMYQDDSFGQAGLAGVLQALDRRDMQPAAIGLYPRNTLAVKTALLDLRQSSPEGIIIIGAYKPVGAFISWAKHLGMEDVTFMTVSFVGSNALAKELGIYGHGVFVTQVVPFPTDSSIPIVNSYLEALAAYDPDASPGFVSLEGYIAGRLAIASLEQCGQGLDRECFLQVFNQPRTMELDGFQMEFGPNDNQGSDAVFLTVIGPDGEYYPALNLKDVPQ